MNIVLFEPQIPGNTGNIARTCVGTQTTLHLVGRLGFSLSDRYLKRAGLDYWEKLDLKIHKDWNAFLTFCHSHTSGNPAPFLFFEKDAEKNLWEAEFEKDSYLIFGSETSGFPQEIQKQYVEHFYKIPMTGPIRSLNLSSSVAVALYEALRQNSVSPSLLVDREKIFR